MKHKNDSKRKLAPADAKIRKESEHGFMQNPEKTFLIFAGDTTSTSIAEAVAKIKAGNN